MSLVSQDTIDAVRTVEEQASRDYFYPVFRQRAAVDELLLIAVKVLELCEVGYEQLAVSTQNGKRLLELKDENDDVILTAMSYDGRWWEIRIHKDHRPNL